MDYAVNNLANAGNQVSHGAANFGVQAPAPQTISSAASRLDALNERLAKAAEGLSIISSQLGALTPVPAGKNSGGAPTSGAVGRLNESAEAAHSSLSEIEHLIAGISRALG